MNIGLYFGGLTLILIGMAGILLVIRMRQMKAAEHLRSVNQVDVSRYAPMQRLLSQEDIALVANDKALAGQLRRQRCNVARGYLRCMSKDFAALHASVREMLQNAEHDSPELGLLILRSRYNFLFSSLRIEMTLWLYRYGIGAIDLSSLVEQITALGAFAQPQALPAAA